MIQDIGEYIYHCEYKPRQVKDWTDRLLFFREDKVAVCKDGRPPLFTPSQISSGDFTYLFSIGGEGFFLAGNDLSPDGEVEYKQIREFSDSGYMKFVLVTAYHLSYWYSHNRFCGACGNLMVHSESERAMICPECGNTKYPEISPCVIVGVHDNNRLVVTKYKGRGFGDYALVAGFCEIGETLEDACRREVMEETGLKIKNLKYYGSQPWGFSRTVLAGFYAEPDGDDKITVDEDELSEAIWVERSMVQNRTSKISLTTRMMDAFRLGEI